MKTRLEYIDAARGLAIFTVVYSHICLFCLPAYDSSAVIDFLRAYFLNAFFFISGIVAYKPAAESARYYLIQLVNKVGLLLVPTFTVGVLYAVSHDIDIVKFMFDPAKYGYWFTLVLFEMFAIYYIVCIISHWFTKSWISTCILCMIAVALYFANKFGYGDNPFYDVMCLGNLANYFIYFLAGLFTQKHKTLISKALRGGAALACAAILTGYFIYIPTFITNFSIIAVVIYLLKNIFRQSETPYLLTPIKHGLVLMGRHTLEIYFIHYFLLFPFPLCVGEYLRQLSVGSMSLSFPELLIVGSAVIAISYTCMLLSYLLKSLPFIPDLVFGTKIIKSCRKYQ